jgi:mRNA-degrading endonuclease toxin of MazEF toxin-antitoxin module
MIYRRGEVVLLNHPYSDASGSKVRPAVVVQEDGGNARLTNTVVAIITRNLQHCGSDPAQVLVDLGTPEGQLSGLRTNSAVTCRNLFTIHERLIHKKIGFLPSLLMQQVNAALKVALELP